MKCKGSFLIVLVITLFVAACQSPTVEIIAPTPVTVVAENPLTTSHVENEEAGNEVQPPTSTPVPEEILDDTQIIVGATATNTPMPANREEPGADGAGGGTTDGDEGGSSVTQSFTNVTINSGAYEGAILETQIAGGGGGEIGSSCVGNGEIIYIGQESVITDELIADGCVLIDGSPFIVCCLINDAAAAQRPWPFSSAANLWDDNLTRIVIHDLDPFENAKILFYEKDRNLGSMSLLGWQEVQVNSNGFLLLKTELPFPFENFNHLDSKFDLVLQRENGVMSNDFGSYLDSDGDGLEDVSEAYNYATDLKNPDSDGDDLLDGEEAYTLHTDPLNWDSDGDGLSDGEEIGYYGTDPLNRDTDGDARTDGDEIAFGTDPVTTSNADNISYVGLEDGGQFSRDFSSDLAWVLTNSQGEFYFQESHHGPWGIFLYDASRDLNVHLDFWTKEMACNDSLCGYVTWVSK